MTNCRALLCQKIPTTLATISPISPMNMNWPTPARLRRVVVPYSASAPNMTAQTPKVLATDSLVYASSISDRVTPFRAE